MFFTNDRQLRMKTELEQLKSLHRIELAEKEAAHKREMQEKEATFLRAKRDKEKELSTLEAELRKDAEIKLRESIGFEAMEAQG